MWPKTRPTIKTFGNRDLGPMERRGFGSMGSAKRPIAAGADLTGSERPSLADATAKGGIAVTLSVAAGHRRSA